MQAELRRTLDVFIENLQHHPDELELQLKDLRVAITVLIEADPYALEIGIRPRYCGHLTHNWV